MNVFLKLDPDQVESIVRNDLIEMYRCPVEDDKVKKALYQVIKFYSTKAQWEEFKKDNA
jgi:hypothetical protein